MHALSKPNVVSRPSASCACASTRPSALVRAQRQADAPVNKVAAAVLSASLAISLAISPAADAKNLADQRREQEEQILAQEKKLEYLIQLQDTARKAELLGKKQVLENQVEQVENAIQRKLVEEKANERAAERKGEDDRALRIAEEAEQIRAQEAALQVAAAKAAAQIERQEIVEKAKVVEEQQKVEKAANSLMEMLGVTAADLGM